MIMPSLQHAGMTDFRDKPYLTMPLAKFKAISFVWTAQGLTNYPAALMASVQFVPPARYILRIQTM